jgi:hypothetical protein
MKRLMSAAAAAAMSLLIWQGGALAGPIVVDGGWYGFCFDGPGSAAYDGCQNDGIGTSGNPTTFTAVGPVEFRVTDAFDYGDTFRVNINGTDYFTSPAPTVVGVTSDPDLAFADPDYSKISVLLGPGDYTVEIFAVDSPWGGGGAYLSVVTTRAVPEPTSLALLGAGLAGLALLRRRRNS